MHQSAWNPPIGGAFRQRWEGPGVVPEAFHSRMISPGAASSTTALTDRWRGIFRPAFGPSLR